MEIKAATEQELMQRLVDVDQRLRTWDKKEWVDLFNKLAVKLIGEGKLYAPSDMENLRKEIVQEILSKGSDASNAEMSLAKLLSSEAIGMTKANLFMQLLVDKINTEVQLSHHRSMEKKAFKFDNEVFHFKLGRYGNGTLAVQVLDAKNAVYAIISVNLPKAPSKGAFWLKIWGENATLVNHLLREGLIEMTGPAQEAGHTVAPEARITPKGLTASLNLETATYDSWETDDIMTKQLAERDGYGEMREKGESAQTYNDYAEDSSMVRPWSPSRHQQELWNRFKEWWKDTWNKEEKGEGDRDKKTPYVAPTQSPAFFLAMPAMKIGAKDSSLTLEDLKEYFIEKTAEVSMEKHSNEDQWGDHHISVTFEFTLDGTKIECTWDDEDLPPGLSETEVLSRIVRFLERRIPSSLAQFKHVRVDDLDLLNRTILMVIPRGEK